MSSGGKTLVPGDDVCEDKGGTPPAAASAEAGGRTPMVVILGPTALGKTAVACRVAERLGSEVVSADSMQVYRGLPVLTNQPTRRESERTRHHLVAVIEPWEDFSVAQYTAMAREAIDGIVRRGRSVVIEGGGGLYLRAALGGLTFGAQGPPELRRELEDRLAREGLDALLAELRERDPLTARRVDCQNPRRVLRALESVLAQGHPLDDVQHGRLWAAAAEAPYRLFGLDDDREAVRRRVDERVLRMVEDGAVDEVRRLLAGGTPSRTFAQAIGVRELAQYIAGELTLADAVAAMQARTRRLVRRQCTWMRKLPLTARIAVAGRSPDAVADDVVQHLRLL